MKAPVENAADHRSVDSPWWAIVEVALIVLVFFVFAGWPPPDVNEAHYLAKAKHYWSPAWCAGDHFLESADAHLVFYWTFGWLTLVLPLPAAAWVGRLLTWTLLAWAWRRLSVAVAPRRLLSVLTAAVFVCLLSRFHLAGEWVVGGVEAKGFAYVLVLLALEAIVRLKWSAAWVLIGAASSFHILVGGWSAVAAALAWLAMGKDRPSIRQMAPAIVLGLALLLPGLIPALNLARGVDAEIVRRADQIYVFERLSHHLVFHRIAHERMALHALLLIGWGLLFWQVRRDPRQCALQRFVAASIAIGVAGAVIDQSLLYFPDLASALLRYYWFRLSDSMAAAGVALAGATLLLQLTKTRPQAAALAAAVLLSTISLANEHLRRSATMLPGAFVQALDQPLNADDARRQFDDWRSACAWIRENTDSGSLFLTPRGQQTFKWFAERGEVWNWKDAPQDAAAIVEWRRRQEIAYPPEVFWYGLTAHSDEAILQIAEEFSVDYLLIDRSQSTRKPKFPRVYPPDEHSQTQYEVYRVGDLREAKAAKD